MKNKIFKNLSMEKKQGILMHILRSKTNGLLKVTEEVALLSAGLKRKQFQIRTFNDISFFAKALDSSKNLSIETIYGVLETTTDKILIDFVTKTSTRTDTKALKKNYPSVYADVVSSSESRKLKFSVQTKAI